MNALFCLIRCFVFSIAIAVAASPANAAIIRGDVPDSEYVNFALDPMFDATGWLAGYTDAGKFLAGSAVLIAPQWVLTAGHVIDDGWTTMGFSLTPAIFDTSIPQNLIMADSWFATPDYGADHIHGFGSDLALVHLTQPVEGIAPVVRATVPSQVGDLIYATGYGQHGTAGNGPGVFDGVERAGTNVIIHDPLDLSFMYYAFDQPSFSSTTPLEIQGSPNDSGGAWFNVHGELIGINSFVDNAFDTYSYTSTTAATKVWMYNDWIDSYVISPVPEPGTILLLGSCAPFLFVARCRQRKASHFA